MSDLVVLVNPLAASGRAAGVWDRLRAARPDLRSATVVLETDPERAGLAVRRILAAGTRALVVVGGDGSIHHAANALLASDHPDTPLGVIPCGTGSDLAATLGIPRDPAEALDHLLAARPRQVDVLEIDTAGRRRVAVNVISAGISGLVVEAVNALPRRGPAAYLVATARALGRYRPLPCRLVADGEAWVDDELLVLAFANGRAFGKGMRIAPRAEPDDGLADAVVVRRVAAWQLPWRLGQLYLGRHLGAPQVAWRRVRELRVEPRAPFPPFDLDGEPLAAGPATLRVRPGALRVLA